MTKLVYCNQQGSSSFFSSDPEFSAPLKRERKELHHLITINDRPLTDVCVGDLSLPNNLVIIICWLSTVCDYLAVGNDTFFRTVTLYYQILPEILSNPTRERLQRYLLGCLLLAYGLEDDERDFTANWFKSKLSKITGGANSCHELNLTALNIFKTLDYDLNLVSSIYEDYTKHIFDYTDLEKHYRFTSYLAIIVLDQKCLAFNHTVILTALAEEVFGGDFIPPFLFNQTQIEQLEGCKSRVAAIVNLFQLSEIKTAKEDLHIDLKEFNVSADAIVNGLASLEHQLDNKNQFVL